MNDNNKEEKNRHDEKNWLEWLVFAISLLLVLGILGYLVFQVYSYQPSPPDIYAEAVSDPSELAPNRYKVTIHNKGGSTAEEVIVEFALFKAGEELEKSDLQVAFSPRASKREGWVIFSIDPESADSVTARVVSYKKP